jgi:hypothetical protein
MIGPRKRSGDFAQVAHSVVRDATTDPEERPVEPVKDPEAVANGQRGGHARAAKLTAERRSEIARQARVARSNSSTPR